MASILEGFLVRLGFEVDQDGMQKFNASVSAVATRVANVGKAAAATGVALGAAFIKATKDVNELYKVANNNGVSIKSFTAISQAVERVGGNAENVGAAFNSLTQNIKTYGRGFESMLKNQLGVSLYDQTGKMRDMGDVFMDLRNKLAEIARTDPGLAKAQADAIGLGVAFDDIMRKDFPAEFERAARVQDAFGDSLDRNAKRAHELTNSLGRIWDSLAMGAKTMAMDFLENTGIDKFISGIADKVESWIPSFVKTVDKTTEQYTSGDRSLLKDYTTHISRNSQEEDYAEFSEEEKAILQDIDKKNASRTSLTENLKSNWDQSSASVDKALSGSKTQESASASGFGKFSGVRGFRNFNPGNLRMGKGQTGTDSGGYAQFGSMVDGYKAMVNQISMYRNAGLENVESIIRKYAPKNENDTESYIKSVVASMQKDLGGSVSARSRLDLNDPKVMDSLVDAMIDHENGKGASNYFGGEVYDQALQEAMQTQRVSKVVTEKDKIPSTGVTVNQNITITGSADPEQTGRAVAKQTKEQIGRYSASNNAV